MQLQFIVIIDCVLGRISKYMNTSKEHGHLFIASKLFYIQTHEIFDRLTLNSDHELAA